VNDNNVFVRSAEAAVGVWEAWLQFAQGQTARPQMPSLLELQTICRETGCNLPELDSFARAVDQPPAFLICGGDVALVSEILSAFGYRLTPPAIPDSAVIWCASPGDKDSVHWRYLDTDHAIQPEAMNALLNGDLSMRDPATIVHFTPVSCDWRILWIPHPRHFRVVESRPAELDVLLGQRAALVILDDTPDLFRDALTEVGQKLWCTARSDSETPEDRQKLIAELLTLLGDRPQDIEIRASAAWAWLTGRLIELITLRRREYQHAVNQHELRLNTSRHLFSQYRTNWIGGIRSAVESWLQNRQSNGSFSSVLDPQKPGPQTDTYLNAAGLPGLWSKIEAFVTDRMAEFVAGLDGLSVKLDLRRITLNDAKARWQVRSMAAQLESVLNEKKIFPAGGGKRGGLVGSLTGRTQAVLDERKGQIGKASRVIVQALENEFATWTSGFMDQVEAGVILQLSALLANRGLPDSEGLKAALAGLDRLEEAISGRRTTVRSPESLAGEWLQTLANRRCIPLYRTP
jgi:hypothetical protein